ncbi:hypothetical protein GCM10022254_58320 [Actinomadura meridiana]|uniref:DUF397 domain-containing protein n=1 Tax=Actinomadura meridiana TaxID=559626 RepID=A0ABP8CH21_9ACTN
MDGVKWRKASRTTANGENCVEIARTSGEMAMRDSKNPDGPQHKFGLSTVAAFFDEIRRGLYDLS